jgi:REP element-mobilizing transposase RayT
MTLFRNKYRVESARKPYWDYTLPGWYFVTICTQNRRPYFGRVVREAMNLSVLGEYASQCWQEIPTHHVNVAIDEFIVMPNHVHGIIVISGPGKLPPMGKRNEISRIPALAEIHPKAGSLGAVVGSFKSAVTRWCALRELTFAWQPRFHDRIIRGRKSLKAVREYIRDNPKNWLKDREFVPEE